MPLQEKGEHSNNFNTQTSQFAKELNNKIGSYDLSKDERSKIQELVSERRDKLVELKQDLNSQLDKNQDRPAPQLNPPNMGRASGQSKLNNLETIHKDYSNNVKDVEKNFDKNLDKILDKARDEGRGPQSQDLQQNRSLTQEFNRDR